MEICYIAYMKGINKGSKNGAWRGDKATKASIHSWVVDNFIRPDHCEICKKPSLDKVFDWSNKDHAYSRKREDWQYVCRKCHIHYDIKYNNLSMNKMPPRKYFWSLNYERCIKCGRNNVKYKARGQCSNCYQNK